MAAGVVQIQSVFIFCLRDVVAKLTGTVALCIRCSTAVLGINAVDPNCSAHLLSRM
jgi:hypothetical protein